MANKFDTLNIIPKPKPTAPFWVAPAIGISLAALLAVSGVAVFYYFQTSSWQAKAEIKKSEYEALGTPENKELEKKVREISQNLEKFSSAFSQHKTSYVFFDFLRSNCHPNVSFSNMSFNVSSGKIFLVGKTDSYRSLSEQIIAFKNLKELSLLEVSDIVLDKSGEISFKIGFTLDQSFFKNKIQ